MTQKPKFFAVGNDWTPEQLKAHVEKNRKEEAAAAARHKQLTEIYIDKIDDAFRDAKFKDSADVAAFHFKNRPNVGVICQHFFDFYGSPDFHDDSRLVWRFVDRYFQDRIALKYEYVRRL
ncbi:TPA: hypothetical protein ACP4ZD_005185 [Klebsiella pneumoniae]